MQNGPRKHILLLSALLLALGAGCAKEMQTTTPTPRTTPPQQTQNGGNIARINNQGLTTFPSALLDRTTLTDLDLSGNALTGSLPAEIRRLTNLRTLNISNNHYTGLPAEVGQLKQLEVLDVSHNLLTGLPYELGNLTNLKRLILTGNAFSEQDLAVILKTLPNVIVER